MANLIFGGHKIGSSVLQFSAARGITSEIENTSQSVGISDGEMLINSRLKSRIIPVTYDFVALSRREFERQLAPLLYSTDVQKLIIDDRPDEFWYAKVDGKIDMDRAYFLGTGTINFLVPDGIAHSVATKTFDNMPYKDMPVNLLTGTSNQLAVTTVDVWGEHVFGSIVPETNTNYCFRVWIDNPTFDACAKLDCSDSSGSQIVWAKGNTISAGTSGYSIVKVTTDSKYANIKCQTVYTFNHGTSAFGSYGYKEAKLEKLEVTTAPVNMISDPGFESGNVPNITWGTAIGTIEVSSGDTDLPKPFGNYMLKIGSSTSAVLDQYVSWPLENPVFIKSGETWTYSYYYASAGSATGQASDYLLNGGNSNPIFELSMGHENRITTGGQTAWQKFTATFTATSDMTVTHLRFGFVKSGDAHGWICIDNINLEKNPNSPWSPNPADPEYYTNTITVHNGGTYPVEPVITATMHADNGMVGIVNDRPGILQFGTQEIDGFTTEESEVALNLAAVQGSHMDNQAATNNPYWGGDPSMPNEQIGNAIWTQDSYDGWKVEPNWPSITGDHKYWNGPSIKHNLAQTHNGNFKSNLTWDVMTRFQTGVAQVGALETTLESDGKPIFQMILKDNSALSDQIWWMCYYKGQLVVDRKLDRSIFTNDKFIQLELQKYGKSVIFNISPWVGNQGRETTISVPLTFEDADDVETKQFSTWFMRDKTWGESTMYLIASTVKWQNVSWYTNIKNRFSDGDVLKIDVANAKTYLNGSLDPTMHTFGNQWERFELPPGDTEITITPSSWAQPFACEVEIREAWL